MPSKFFPNYYYLFFLGRKNYPSNQLILNFSRKRLENDKIVADYNIMKEYPKNMIRQNKCCEEKLIYIESNNTKIYLKICLCKKS